MTKSGSFHVHHLWYESGRDPWDYPDEALVSLCSDCHVLAPKIDWKRAFLDLNLCERELFEIAAQLHWVRRRADLQTREIQQKYKTRFFGLYTYLDFFESMEDVDEFYESGFIKGLREKYTKNG